MTASLFLKTKEEDKLFPKKGAFTAFAGNCWGLAKPSGEWIRSIMCGLWKAEKGCVVSGKEN